MPASAFLDYLDLGALGPGGSEGLAISENGLVVVGTTFVTGSPFSQAFAWSQASGMLPLLDTPQRTVTLTSATGAGRSASYGVNGDGSVVVGRVIVTSGGFDAFVWTPVSGMTLLPAASFNVNGPVTTFWEEARDVDDAGQRAVGSGLYIKTGTPAPVNANVALLWDLTTPGLLIVLGDLAGGVDNGPHDFSIASAISGDGSTVVGYSTNVNGDREAFLWQSVGAGMIGLGGLIGGPGAGFISEARGVSQDGSYIVGAVAATGGGREGFIYDTVNGAMTGIGRLLGGTATARANDISNDGTRIVGQGDCAVGPGCVAGQTTALIWDMDLSGGTPVVVGGGPQRLYDVLEGNGVNMAGIVLRDATGISGDGLVVTGTGDFGNGLEAYIASENLLTSPTSLADSALGTAYLTSQGSALLNEFNNGLLTVARHYQCGTGANPASERCSFVRGGGEFGVAAVDGDRYTGMGGLLFQPTSALKWGGAIGVGHSNLRDLTADGAVDMTMLEAGLFVDYRPGISSGLHITGTGAIGLSRADLERSVRNGGTLIRYTGDTAGVELLTTGKIGYSFAMPDQRLTIEPFVGAAVGLSYFAGYDEANAIGSIDFGEQDLRYYEINAGVSTSFQATEKLHIFSESKVIFNQGRYSGFDFDVADLSLSSETPSISDNGTRGRVQLGANYRIHDRMHLSVDGDYQFQIEADTDDFSVLGINFGMSYQF